MMIYAAGMIPVVFIMNYDKEWEDILGSYLTSLVLLFILKVVLNLAYGVKNDKPN